jgi:transposase
MLRLSWVSQSLLAYTSQWKGVITLKPLYVGIDVSSKTNVAYLMNPDGSKHSSFTVQNNGAGAKILSERIVSALTAAQLNDVIIGLESTSIYGDSLVYALREDGSIGRFHRKIHVLNPKQVRKFKEAYPDLPKNDFVDAFVIADHLRFGRIASEVYMDDYRYKALQTLTRARFYAVRNLAREKQRFSNYLFMKCSGLAQQKIFPHNTSATAIALMEQFETVDELAYANLDELTSFITKTGRGRFSDPVATAKAVQAAARGSYRLPKTVTDSVNQVMSVSVAAMRALESQIKTLDKAIEQQFEIIPNTLTSIPGIGKVYSAGIIAEIGDIHRFQSQAAVAKFAGLVWTQHQSGDFEAESSHLIKSGNRFLRYYLLEAANSVSRCDSEFRRYYDLKFREVNKFQHKRALALTARKLVRLVFRLLNDNRLYIPPEEH